MLARYLMVVPLLVCLGAGEVPVPATATLVAERPERPTMRENVIDLTYKNAGDKATWVILSGGLEEKLEERIGPNGGGDAESIGVHWMFGTGEKAEERTRAIEVEVSTYVLRAFRVPAHGVLHIADWRLETFGDIREMELWEAPEILVNEKVPLAEWLGCKVESDAVVNVPGDVHGVAMEFEYYQVHVPAWDPVKVRTEKVTSIAVPGARKFGISVVRPAGLKPYVPVALPKVEERAAFDERFLFQGTEAGARNKLVYERTLELLAHAAAAEPFISTQSPADWKELEEWVDAGYGKAMLPAFILALEMHRTPASEGDRNVSPSVWRLTPLVSKLGPDAAEAVPVLTEMLDERFVAYGTSHGALDRVAMMLGAIGPAAKGAMPKLKELAGREVKSVPEGDVPVAAKEALRRIGGE